MDDHDLLGRIAALVEKEHKLEEEHAGQGLDPESARELKHLEVALDQCWDLLRQRRARRRVGLDPDDAEVRPEDVVEGYRQ